MLEFAGRATDDLSVAYEAAVEPRTGAATLRVPVPAPTGRAGIGPALALAYSSGAANSAYGVGWSLHGLPAVAIDTSEHVPRWDGTDGFEFGGEDLVPWLEPDEHGNPRPRGLVEGPWSIAYYRTRTAGSQVRVEKWVERATGRAHFRVRDARNVLTIYGARTDGSSRLADPDHPDRTLAWLPELQLDPVGNGVWLEYARETFDNVDQTAPFERRRATSAQRYLKTVRYGNAQPFTLTDDAVGGTLPAAIRWCFALVLDYGDHGEPDRPAALPDRAWPARPDAFSDCRGGFEVRTYRLCRRILSFHDFDELGPGPTLVGSLSLVHREDPAGSTLEEIAWIGHRRENGAFASRALPPLRMTYAAPATSTGFQPAPATTQENVPSGLSGRRFLFLDLEGNGLPGILAETETAWFFKSNDGDGSFGAQTLVAERPTGRQGAYALGDVDGDGDAELAQFGGRLAGRYRHDREAGRWIGFRPFPTLPHVEALGPRAQWVDLNGDGRPDVVVPRADRLTWFPSDGETFSGPVEVPLPRSPASAPPMAEDASLSLFFADMNGDGLVDLVRVANGSVEYWPSLGNGRFGDAVVLDGGPRLASDDEFDPARVRFADLDGSGTSDLVYLGRGEVRAWINASGNRLVPGTRLEGLPYFHNLANVAILDFLGDGRASLVWSDPLPGRDAPLQYLPLSGTDLPRLLLAVDDGLGQETRFSYSSSARHYLRDLRAGRPWLTRLPRHVAVVDRREVIDRIGGTRSAQRFEYRDGAFDGGARRFLGFGRVDVYDREPAAPPAPDALPDAFPDSPPLLTRTWFHLGPAERTRALAADTYAADAILPLLPGLVLDDGALTADEADEAERAVAGRAIRVERWSIDGQGAPAAHPIDVAQTSYRLRRLQRALPGGRPAFAVLPCETLSAVYEGTAGDPRVTHHVAIETDAYDVLVREAEIAYARRPGRPVEVAAQAHTSVVVRDHSFVHVDEPGRFELGVAVEGRDLELVGVATAPEDRITRDRLRQPDVAAALAAPVPHHVTPPPGVGARLLSCIRSTFWNDARESALPFGDVGAIALVHHEEVASFAPDFVSAVFGDRIDADLVPALGYFLRDGLWWHADETHIFGDAALFFQRTGSESIDGARTELEYDAYALEVVAERDAVGNRTSAGIDYHLPAPWRLTDANGTVCEVRYDPLGVVTAATSSGHVLAERWGFDSLDAVEARTPADAGELLADPARFLQGASRYVWYDLDAWRRDGTPPAVFTLVREELRYDGRGGTNPDGRIGLAAAYLDGLGRTLQAKTLVEAGEAIARGPDGQVAVDGSGRPVLAFAPERWQVSGHVVYDGKQQPRRQYEPYFSPSSAYEGDPVLQQFGVVTLTLYDAAGREAGQALPNGTFTKTTHTAWEVERADANDTVLTSSYRAVREDRPADDPEKQALEHAKTHADTTASVLLDPQGREVGTLARGGATAADRRTESRLDANGHVRELIDPRGLTAFTHRRDMEGRVLFTGSIDGGDAWSLPDAQDRMVRTWDGRGVSVERGYDLAGRPTFTHVRGGGLDHRVEEHEYGEVVADGAARNLRGRLSRLRDGAGETSTTLCDPLGEVLDVTRRLRAEASGEPDWRSPVALDEETFTTSADYDALGRPARLVQPDGSVRRLTYCRSGAVLRETVTTPDGVLTDHPILADAAYDALGRRGRLALGNGVEVSFAYDAETRHLARHTARLGGRVYQDAEYVRDPAGNIVRITDHAQTGAGAVVAGAALPARRDCAYDAHYRLIRASGRVHQALLQHDDTQGLGTFKGTRHLSLNNGAALEPFTRTYDYDASGNLLRIRHLGAHAWTTEMWVSPASNRSLPALDRNGVPIVDPEAKFDAAGQLTEFDHLRRVEWSWRGTMARAVVVERPGGTDDQETYTYGADAMRVRKVTTRLDDGVVETTEKVYLGCCERKRIRRGDTLVVERWTSSFTDGADGQRIALLHRWIVDDLGRETDSPARPRIHYQLSTHQGSSAIEIAQNGEVISYEEYFPYGGSSFIAGNVARDVSIKEYRYSGKERDDTTGFYYYGYRYYAPWMGRWLTPDPIGPEDDLNLYQFVLGDPVGNVDADGLESGTPSPASQEDIVWLGNVRRTTSERRARAVFNAGRGIELGIQATRLRRLGNGNWLIVSYTRIPPRLLPYAQRFHSIEAAEAYLSFQNILNAVNPPNTDPADPANGNGGNTQGNGGNGQNGSAGDQPPAPPGANAGAGNDANAGTGAGRNPGADPDAVGPGRGSGDEGNGPGSGLQGRGSGGGGQAEAGVGRGTTGEGRTSGTGVGEATGAGTAENPAGRRAGRGQGQGGEGSGQRPGGRTGGPSGPGIHGPRGGNGDDGVTTGNPNGSAEGVEGGSANGVEGGSIGGTGTDPSQTGTGTPATDATGTTSGTGTNTGGTSEEGLGGEGATGSNPGTNRGAGQGRTDEARREASGTRRTGPGGGPTQGEGSGSAEGHAGFRENALDTITRWAGYANFEFSSGGSNGQRGGLPGGRGTLNLGWVGQVGFIALVAISWIGPARIASALRAGTRFLGRALSAAGRGVARAAGSLARAGLAAARALPHMAASARTAIAGLLRRTFTRPPAPPARLVDAYRFANALHPETLLPRLASAGRFTQWRVNFMMRFRWYRAWRANRHMQGFVRNSPFVSLLENPARGAATTDPWLRTIITGRPGVPGVGRAPDLGHFRVPVDRLVYPPGNNALSRLETEVLYWGNDLLTRLATWRPNPF